jgi:hypothetical protein
MCFLCGPCRDRKELSRIEMSWLVNDWVSELDNRWGSVFVSCCCKKLVVEAGDSSEHPPLEAATEQRLVKEVFSKARNPKYTP